MFYARFFIADNTYDLQNNDEKKYQTIGVKVQPSSKCFFREGFNINENYLIQKTRYEASLSLGNKFTKLIAARHCKNPHIIPLSAVEESNKFYSNSNIAEKCPKSLIIRSPPVVDFIRAITSNTFKENIKH